MKRITKFLTLALACACASVGHAQDAITQTVQSIVKNSPELKAQRATLLADRKDQSDENALENPEFALSRVWGYHGIGNKLQVDLSQSFDWPGLYRARSRAADLGFSAGEMEIASAELDMAMQSKELLLELVYIRKCLALDQLLFQNIAEMQEASEVAFRQGNITILDQRKLQIERYKMENEIAAHRNREAQIEAALLGMCPGLELTLDSIDAYPMEQILAKEVYMEQVAQLDPLFMSQRIAAEQEAANMKAATLSRFPSFSLGFQHQSEMGDNFSGFTFGMTLPFFQNRKARSAAMLRQDAADTNARLILAQRQAEVESRIQEMEIWRMEVENYNKVFGDNSYLTLLKKALDGGEMSILEYLTETNYYHETTATFLEAEYNYSTTLAWLNRYSLLQ